MNQIFVKYYEYLYQKVLNKPSFTFKPTSQEVKMIENFIDYLDKVVGWDSIGEQWIFDYMVYLFKERKDQLEFSKIKNQIPVNWVFGIKAYELYQKKNQNWLYFNGLFIKQHNISFLGLKVSEMVKSVDFEEDLRDKYVKEDYPLHLCYQTVVYYESSEHCKICVSREDCKIINV